MLNTVTQYLSELHPDNGSVYSSCSWYGDYNSDSNSDVPSTPPPSGFSGLKYFAHMLSLTWSTQSSSMMMKKKKKKLPPHCVNQIHVNIHDPLASLIERPRS